MWQIMWPPHGHRHTATATRPPPHGHRHTATATWPPPHGHRHMATATRPPPHGHRHMVTATRPPPHGHRHTATATRPPPHGHRHTVTATRPSHPWPGHVPGHMPGHVPGYVISHVPGCDGTFNHGNLPGPLALRHSRRPLALLEALGPLAPTATSSLWPMATLFSWPTPFVNLGRWRPLSLGGPWRPWRPRPLAISNLRRPLAHGAPLATIGYQGVIVIRNGRVIEPIVRGGGHGRRGDRDGLGGMSWWCGGMS